MSALRSALPLVRDLEAAELRAEDSYASASARLEAARRVCPDRPVKIAVVQSVRPSQSQIFALSLQGGVTSSDDLTVKTDNAVLTSVSVTADDQSGAIAKAIGSSIGQILAPSPWASLDGYSSASPQVAPYKPSPPTPREGCNVPTETIAALEFYLENERCLSAEHLSWLLRMAPSWAEPEPLTSVLAALPRETKFDLSDLLWQPRLAELAGELPDPVKFGVYELRVDCGVFGASNRRGESYRTIQGTVNGLVLAMPLSCRYSVLLGNRIIGEGAFLGTTDLQLYVMPVHRQFLVRNETTLTLTDGTLTEAKLKRPSPAAAIISLPGTILGGVVSGITAGLQGDQAIRDAEAARLRAETALLTARAQREASQSPPAPPAAPTPQTPGPPPPE